MECKVIATLIKIKDSIVEMSVYFNFSISIIFAFFYFVFFFHRFAIVYTYKGLDKDFLLDSKTNEHDM